MFWVQIFEYVTYFKLHDRRLGLIGQAFTSAGSQASNMILVNPNGRMGK